MNGEKANLLAEKVDPFLYKVWFLQDVLELVEELKLSALKSRAGFAVKPLLALRTVRHAGFELLRSSVSHTQPSSDWKAKRRQGSR